MRRLAGAITVLVLVGAVVAAVVLLGGSSKKDNNSYWVELDNAFGLVQGGDMKVAGVRAGTIQSMKLDPKSLHALIQIKIKQSGFGSLRADTSCEARPQSLIGEYFLDCNPGVSSSVLKAGSVIPVTRTSSTVAPDLVNDILRRPYKERLAIILDELGAGVAGNGQALNQAIKRASPGLREADRVLAILAQQNQTLANLARDGDTVLTAFSNNRRDVSRFVDTANRASTASAERRAALAEGFRRLPGFLAQLRPAMSALGTTADQTTPALRNIDASAVQLKTFLGRLGSFSTASTPAFQALGNAAVTGSKAVKNAGPTVDLLNQFAQGTPELGKNLAMVLAHLDDRNFAAEPDPRSPNGQGYTGLEDLLRYTFYQTLSTNLFDANNHLLNVNLFADTTCSMYPDINKVKTALQNPGTQEYRCIAQLGPTQPGINAPDPTAPAGAALRSAPVQGASAAAPAASGSPATAPLSRQATPTALLGLPDASGTPASAPAAAGTSAGPVAQAVAPVKQVAATLTGAANAALPPAVKSEKPLLDYLLGP
ncbi:MAG: hypothetical protein NVSMB51_10190 [Solirubrobacteraceae bacterium]